MRLARPGAAMLRETTSKELRDVSWLAWMGQAVFVEALLMKTQHGVADLRRYGAGEGPGQ
jgi:hypothetical protein